MKDMILNIWEKRKQNNLRKRDDDNKLTLTFLQARDTFPDGEKRVSKENLE